MHILNVCSISKCFLMLRIYNDIHWTGEKRCRNSKPPKTENQQCGLLWWQDRCPGFIRVHTKAKKTIIIKDAMLQHRTENAVEVNLEYLLRVTGVMFRAPLVGVTSEINDNDNHCMVWEMLNISRFLPIKCKSKSDKCKAIAGFWESLHHLLTVTMCCHFLGKRKNKINNLNNKPNGKIDCM